MVQLSVRAMITFWQPMAQSISATPESRAAIFLTGRGTIIVLLLASVTVTLVGAGVGLGVGFEDGVSVAVGVELWLLLNELVSVYDGCVGR